MNFVVSSACKAGVAELADALDSKSSIHRFHTITCREKRDPLFIGEMILNSAIQARTEWAVWTG
jgi:hypothetical protein